MNEKLISEFIKKATEVHQPKPHSNSTENSDVFNKEKFAELIIRECAEVANSGIDPTESHLISDDILKHFGIE